MADTMVLHKITWPHELVYTTEGQPIAYDNLSVVLFVSGYLAVIEKEMDFIKPLMAQHLQELVTDTEQHMVTYHWDLRKWVQFTHLLHLIQFTQLLYLQHVVASHWDPSKEVQQSTPLLHLQ